MSDIAKIISELRKGATSGVLIDCAVLTSAADGLERLCSDLDEAEGIIDAFGKITPQQYEKELASLRKQLVKCRADAFEECAKIAEEKYVDISWHGYYRMAANGIARKIRRSALTEAAMKSVSDAHWPDTH